MEQQLENKDIEKDIERAIRRFTNNLYGYLVPVANNDQETLVSIGEADAKTEAVKSQTVESTGIPFPAQGGGPVVKAENPLDSFLMKQYGHVLGSKK